MKFIVKKSFELNDEVLPVGELLEMSEADAAGFISKGKLALHVEEKSINAKVDSKELADAISKALVGLVPVQKSVEKKVSYGEYLQSMAKGKTINITTNTQGQYATTTYWDAQIDTDILKQSGIVARAYNVSLTGDSNIYKKNVVNSTGSGPAVFAESATITPSQPTLTQFSFTLEKLAYLFYATEEAIEDTGALVQEIEREVPNAFAKFIENGMLNTSGTVLVGVVGNSNTVSVPAISLQNGTFLWENATEMFASCKNPAQSVWVVSRSAYAQILRMEDSSGEAVFIGSNGAADAPFGRLLGLPILISDYCATVGTVGDVVLGDFGKYMVVNKGGLMLKASSEVAFLADQMVFKFKQRLAGKPIGLKLTATDGTSIGDFVTVATRNGAT